MKGYTGGKKRVQQKPLEGALEVFVVIPLERVLAGAVTGQGSEPLCWAEAGTEDGKGRGAAGPTVQAICPAPKSLQ